MAPNSVGRPRRPRRRPLAAALPRDRLPVGTRGGLDPNASASHIQIIPRMDDDTSQSGFEDNTPVHTNQSYLTEIDPGLDLHKRDSHQREHSGQTTFADMARAGVGPDHTTRGEFMASQEPQPLNNFIRFKKKGKGRQWTPIDEENSSSRTSSPIENIDDQPARKMTFRHPIDVGVNPVDALRAHMDNVRATFGRPLPDPSYLTANFGRTDREIQFVLHPNGDIHAHQWLAQNFEWQPVGQYIYGRKVLEGILSQEPLRGQKIGSFSPQNMLQHFIAVAKQYEEASVAKAEPKGYEPGTARSFIRPAVPLMTNHPQRPPLSTNPSNPMSRSFSSAAYPSQPGGGLPTLSTLAIRQPAPTRPRPPPVFGEDTFGSVIDLRSSSPPNSYNAVVSPLAHRKQSTPELSNYPLSTRSSFSNLLPSRNLADSAHSSFSGIVPPGFKAGIQERFQVQGLGRQPQRAMILEEDESSDDDVSPTATRTTMSTTTRNSYFDGAGKSMPLPATKKPAQPNPFASWTFTNHKRNSLSTQSAQASGIESAAYNPYASKFATNRASERPTSSGASEPRVTLTQSEPEAGYSQRQCHILTKLSTANMTNEELMMYSRPTEQNWKGPFFTGDDEDLMTKDEKLMDWWHSGEMSRRKNWTEVHGTYSSKYATPKFKSFPLFAAPQVPKQQAPIGTAASFGLRDSAVEWKGSAARDVAKLGW